MKLLLIYVDGLGYDLVDEVPVVQAHSPSEVRTLLGFSIADFCTAFSGKYPDEHGVWNLYYYNKSGVLSPMKYIKQLPFSGSRHSRLFLSIFLSFLRGNSYPAWLSNIPIDRAEYFDTCLKKVICEPNALGTRTIFDLFRDRGLQFICVMWPLVYSTKGNSYRLDSYSDQKACSIVEENLGKFDVYYVHLTEIDHEMHIKGKNAVKEAKARLNKNLETTIESFKKAHPSGNVIIFSDHGMSDVHRKYDLVKIPGLRHGKDYISFLDATMARFWFLNKNAEYAVEKHMPAEGRFLTEKDMAKERVPMPPKFGEKIFLLEKGGLFAPNYFQKGDEIRSMHGYDPNDSEQSAFFACDFKRPRKIQMNDLFGLVSSLLAEN